MPGYNDLQVLTSSGQPTGFGPSALSCMDNNLSLRVRLRHLLRDSNQHQWHQMVAKRQKHLSSK